MPPSGLRARSAGSSSSERPERSDAAAAPARGAVRPRAAGSPQPAGGRRAGGLDRARHPGARPRARRPGGGPRRAPGHPRSDRRARPPHRRRRRGRPADPGPAARAQPAHLRRRDHGGRRARHRRHGAHHGGAGDGGARAHPGRAERLLPHRRLPRAADDGHRQRPARHRAHRRGARRGRAGDQRSPLQPADARRAAPPRGRRARRRV